MKEKLLKYRESAKSLWIERNRTQKGILIGSLVFIIALIIVISLFAFNSKFVPLYNNLSLQEVGQIKTELDARGIPYELENGGTTISVPEEQVDNLLVDLAGQGIPNSGSIDYSFFSENSSWGVTDNEFNMMKLDAMQSELANLIKSIEGIDNAEVMINIPEEPVFVSEATQPASASIILHTKPGHQFEGNQIESLYHLVSKAIPNLSPDEIVIRNQYLDYFDRNTQNNNGAQDTYTYQQTVKKDIERDIQKRVQQMLGAMVGPGNVIVSVTTDIDFTSENRIEEIVEPVDPEDLDTLPVSIETIHETYTGNGANAGGVVGAGEEEVPNYPGDDNGDNGEYELVKETVNNEFNRIRKEIIESPYKIRDLGIQVAINRVEDRQQEEQIISEEISTILNSIITTSIDKDYGEVDAGEKTSIVFQEFSETATTPQSSTSSSIPTWAYIVGGALILLLLLLIILLVRRRNSDEETITDTELYTNSVEESPSIPTDQPESESVARRKQLEKMAKDKPEDFAKLLRSWLSEE
ncbi:flagellar basal-body MS-ring/collar protein FliF [Ornithinibacillus halophilus]|uniref:Flagellar M-ring protein n=1 Tax=Ornithinibacillus halophilus TaxID=930117 RepID=A0A1M5CAM2_9BACI|nr:flagellar basal-body MS-ring/collar protein FliF [Ornithinibacillus halophilus]SHF51482.1 flagellar M-ring protein FliF [Ornithinibacillus halophilus]